MGFKKNNPGCNCCEGCIICDNDCGWTVEAGTADTSLTGVVDITAANTVVTSNANSASGVVEIVLTASLSAFDDGDEARVIFKYLDADNYWYGQLTIGTSGTLKLYERSGGVTTQRATAAYSSAAGDTYTLRCCYGNNAVTVTETTAGVRVSYTTGTAIDDQLSAGVGSGACSTLIEFTSFVYEYMFSVDKPDCNQCHICKPTDCVLDTIPESIQVVISGIANNSCTSCGSFNGTFVLDFVPSLAPALCVWRYYFPSAVCLVDFIQLNMNNGLLTLYITQNSPPNASVSLSGAGSTNCATWSGVSLSPPGGSPALCVMTGASATVTAL